MALLQEKTCELTIIILNYKTDEYTVQLLNNLKSRNGMEIIIVDNSPTRDLESKLPKRNDLTYIFTGKNLGFAGGNNKGIQQARGEWILLLNNDTVTSTEDMFTLLKETKRSEKKVSTPRLSEKDGRWQRSVGYFDGLLKNPVNYFFARPRYISYDVKQNVLVDFAHFTAILLHKSVFERIGLLDDRNYFMYFEDIDFCQRLMQHSFPILYVPQVTVTHFAGASADLDMQKKNENYQNSLQQYLKKYKGELIMKINTQFHFFQ